MEDLHWIAFFYMTLLEILRCPILLHCSFFLIFPLSSWDNSSREAAEDTVEIRFHQFLKEQEAMFLSSYKF